MGGYKPLKIIGNETGLVQEREEFLLPDDAYPILQNAYIWREKIRRKNGNELLGRLQRNIGTTDGAGNIVVVITPFPIQNGISSFVIDTDVFVDPGESPPVNPVNLLTNSIGTGVLDRTTGTLTINGSIANTAVQYFPGLPVMGICKQELTNSALDDSIFFDQNYAYKFDNSTLQFKEFIPGTTWNARGVGVTGTDFFWSTNYWVSQLKVPGTMTNLFSTDNRKLFWVTNNTGQFGANADSPRITDGTTWVDFDFNTWHQIDATSYLFNWSTMLPFRGRLLVFNTWEGPTKAGALSYSNRIRWSAIGNPFIPYAAGPPATGSWRDDIQGKGGFLDIPTSEDIIAIGFVRDNLVIYCERSTWQLRYTGRSIAPFQIERVNSEIGAQSPFSAVQFDTALIGIGDKGIVQCDSFKSERIDVKIPDLIFRFNTDNDGLFRVQGIRDFINRLAFWTFPGTGADQKASRATIFPTQRLVYNYENDSWATFSDSYTALGTFQPRSGRNWLNTKKPWVECNFPWIDSQVAKIPLIVGGNQQGFVHKISVFDSFTTNDSSLFITNITGNNTTPTVVKSPNHNMQTGFVIQISGIKSGTDFDNLNGLIFGINVIDANTFALNLYNLEEDSFNTPQLDSSTKVYKGGGLIKIRDNFVIQSKKFNFLDDGENIQFGYLDILMPVTKTGAISLNVFLDYNDNESINTIAQNTDPFFNTIILTSQPTLNNVGGSKFWQRVFCPTRGNFITLQYTLSNAQMAGNEQLQDVQIDAQVLWLRKAGRMNPI